MKDNLKRVVILGLPGSGKSTFAIQMGEILSLPVYHLDQYKFDRNRKRNHLEFLELEQARVQQDKWIIEGCALSTLETRFAKADLVIYFHLPRYLCLWRLYKRRFKCKNHLSDTGCLKGINWTLIKYTWLFDKNKRPVIDRLRQCYPHVKFIEFCHSKEIINYLNQLT